MKQNLLAIKLFFLLLSAGIIVKAQTSNNITIAPISTPTLNVCLGQGNFVVRLNNVTGAAISNITFRDSMPAGINYVAGSVGGIGVTMGSVINANNVVTFTVAVIPANSFVDITFAAAAQCNAPSVAANVINTYKASWGTLFTNPLVTAAYSLLFPSLSITVTNSSFTGNCLTPFVRQITICNGGFGPVDSVTFNDAEGNTSLIIQGFNFGTQTGLGTNNAKTVLKAADFLTVGNHDGKLDQNECIVLNDTLKITGSTSPITGTLLATWGCNANACSNPNSNSVIVNTTINSSSPLQPSLTRTLTVLGPPDSSGQIYNRPVTYREVVTNNSSVTAVNATIYPAVLGLKYIRLDSVWLSKNSGPRFHPTSYYINYGSPYWFQGTPNVSLGNVIAPILFANRDSINNIRLNLGDLMPGDSVVITFEVRTAGPVTRVNDFSFNHCGTEGFCAACYRVYDGPSIGGAVDAQMTWQGCPSGTFQQCYQRFPQNIYTGLATAAIAEYDASNGYAHFLARFRGFNIIDSTASNRCAYYNNDTVHLVLSAQVMDLPFYTDKSKFSIKIYTSGGVKWAGNINKTWIKLNNSATPWFADHVVDSTAQDSTIRIYFKRSACPNSNFGAYNSYNGGSMNLNIYFINTCPGPAQKRFYMTRIFTIDSTNTEPAIEAGPTSWTGLPGFTWNSNCPGLCSNGVSILTYSHTRTTFDAPDNNQDGIPDTSGVIDLTKVNTNLVTWGDTLQLKYKLIVHTTNPGGVPSLYVNSSINYSDINAAITCNNFLTKAYPSIVLKRPGVGIYTGTGTSIPVNTNNFFLANLSLQGAGGVTIPGVTTYLEGDTVELTQNLVYYKVHSGWGPTTWSFLHVPFTANVINPGPAQQLKCDSVVCNFQTVDMFLASQSYFVSATACSDSGTFRMQLYSLPGGAGCGTNYFPYESRTVYTPTSMKVIILAASGFIFKTAQFYLHSRIAGSTACSYRIYDQYLPASLYTISGDTVSFDFKQITAFYGIDYRTNNLYSNYFVDITVKYNLLPSQGSCTLDHIFPQGAFAVPYRCEASRPVDTTGVTSNYFNGVTSTTNGGYGGNGGSAFLNLAGGNQNNAVMYAGNSITATQNQVIVPVRYTVSNGSGLNNNCWIAVPSRPGIIVDSVKEKLSGIKIPTVIGSNIYQLGNVGGNGATKDYDIYTHLSLCTTDSLFVYADRTPCTGYPVSWAGYGCQSNANASFFRYVIIGDELQLNDSLYTDKKDLCVADTIQFQVVNSQLPTAYTVKIGIAPPVGISFIPGTAQMKRGNGAWVTATDPVLVSGNNYSWSMPTTDTLAGVSAAPNNILRYRVALITSCSYVSGSQILSSISGTASCGAITSLYNTNPNALTINGAISNYNSNVQATVAQITGCNNGVGYPYTVNMPLSGTSGIHTGTADSAIVLLPGGYKFVSYNNAVAGSHNAPLLQPQVR